MIIKILLQINIIIFILVQTINAQWTSNACGLPYDSKFQSLVIASPYCYAATDFGVFSNEGEATHWSRISDSIPDRLINCVLLKNSVLFAGTEQGHIFCTSNNGLNWSNVSAGLPANTNVICIVLSGNYLFAGLDNRLVYISQDNGITWTNFSNGLPVVSNGKIFLGVNGSTIYAGTDGAGIYKTQNNGANWQAVNLGLFNQNVRSFCFSGSNIFAGTIYGGIYLSTNGGLLWQQKNSGLNDLNINALTVVNDRIIAGTDLGIFISTNNGNSWFPRNEGWNNPKVLSFSTGNFLNAGTESDMVWMRPLIEIVSVINISNSVPDKFTLFQNYPNPFNPVTKIKFDISPLSRGVGEARGVFTSLKVFDITGKEIAALVNEELNPGTYEVTFESSNYSSGIYFYKLTVGSSGTKEIFTQTKKMLLTK